jgi:hypothetical protein
LEEGDRKIFDEKILEHATQYYSKLFGPAPGNLFQVDREVWDGLEQLLDNQVLCDYFSEKEINDALFQMESNKVVSPDNILAEFYQVCWGIVKEDIVNLFHVSMLGIWMLAEFITTSSLCSLK